MEGERDTKIRDANCSDSYLTKNEDHNDLWRKTSEDDLRWKKTVHSFLFIRNQFIRNEFSGGKKFKKLENWDKGNLRNFVYIRFHEIQEITRFILYKKAYSLFGSLSFIGLLACSFVVFWFRSTVSPGVEDASFHFSPPLCLHFSPSVCTLIPISIQ